MAEKANSGYVDWENIGNNDKAYSPKSNSNNSQENRPKVERLKLEAGKTYRIRPVHKPKDIWRYWNERNGKKYSAICAENGDAIINSKYNIKPSLKYGLNVIDREDGILKVMEASPGVFRAFKEWSQAAKKSPGGKDGGDFSIKVEATPKLQYKVKYTTTFIEPKPFTDEERAMLAKNKADTSGLYDELGLYNLNEMYKPLPKEDIERILFGTGTKKDQPQAAAPSSPAATQAAPEVSNDDVPF